MSLATKEAATIVSRIGTAFEWHSAPTTSATTEGSGVCILAIASLVRSASAQCAVGNYGRENDYGDLQQLSLLVV